MRTRVPKRITHLCTLARKRIIAGDYDGARSYLQAARSAAGDDSPPEMLRLFGDLTAQLHNFAEGVQLLEQALDRFRLAEDAVGEATTAADLAALLQRAGNLARARNLIEWALARVEAGNYSERTRMLNIAATIASFQGRLENAFELLSEAELLAEGRVACWVALNKAAALSNLGDHAEAQQSLLKAEAAVPPGDQYAQLMLNYARTWCALVEDDFSAAKALCQRALHLMAAQQHPIVYYPTQATLGVLAREAGALQDAESLLAEAFAPLQARHDHAAVMGIRWQQALLARQQGQEETAEEHLAAALGMMRVGGYGTTLLWQPSRFVELCVWAIERGIEATHASWLLQTSLVRWGDTISVANGTDSTRNKTVSVPVLHMCLAKLTTREYEIVSLAAQGMRDREIAERLCLSLRTVQNHLNHCYDKLGVRNRTEAVRLLLNIDPADEMAK